MYGGICCGGKEFGNALTSTYVGGNNAVTQRRLINGPRLESSGVYAIRWKLMCSNASTTSSSSTRRVASPKETVCSSLVATVVLGPDLATQAIRHRKITVASSRLKHKLHTHRFPSRCRDPMAPRCRDSTFNPRLPQHGNHGA